VSFIFEPMGKCYIPSIQLTLIDTLVLCYGIDKYQYYNILQNKEKSPT